MKLRYYLRGLGIGIIVTALIMGIAGRQKQQLTDDEIRTKAAMLGMVDGGTVLSSLTNTEESGQTGQSTDPETGKTADESAGQISGNGNFEGSEDSAVEKESESGAENAESSAGNTESAQSPENTESTQSPENTKSPENAESTESTQSTENTENSGGADRPVSEEQNNPPSAEESSAAESASRDTAYISFTVQRGASSEVVSRGLVNAGLIDDASGFNSYLVDNGYSRVISVGTYQIPANASWKDIAQIITRRR